MSKDNIRRLMDKQERDQAVVCPACRYEYTEAETGRFKTAGGSTHKTTCPRCLGDFTVLETVTRTFDCDPLMDDDEEAPQEVPEDFPWR